MPDLNFYLTAAQSCKDQDTLLISVPRLHAQAIISHLITNGFNARSSLVETNDWNHVLIEIIYFDDPKGGES